MMRLIQISLFAILFSHLSFVMAAPAPVKPEDNLKSPLGCRDVGYSFALKTMTISPKGEDEGDGQSLFFVFNKRQALVYVDQLLPDKHSARSTYLNHTIPPQQWAAFATNEPELHFMCSVDEKNLPHGKIVDCEESLKVCEYVRVKFGMNNRGNYWFAGSNSRGGMVGDVTRYGIIPR